MPARFDAFSRTDLYALGIGLLGALLLACPTLARRWAARH